MNGSARFFVDLPVLTDFSAVTQPASFAPLPEDWHIAACDVRNSSAAVQAGNYKHVNTVAAAAVTAVLNAAGHNDVPFIFEGDGCMFCVPPGLRDAAREALAKTRDLASRSFGLELRVAPCPHRRCARPASTSWWRATACRRTTCRPYSPAAAWHGPSAT